MGYYAYVSTEEIPDLNFLVRGKYDDMYLERVLEYEAEKQIESMFPRSKCTAIMTLRSNKSTVYDDLYKLYENLGRPAQWSDVPQYMKFAELYISIDDTDATKIYDVVNAVEGCIFKSFRLCIENNDQKYDCVLNDEQHYVRNET